MLYDGVCGLCEGAVQFVLARDRRGLFQFAALQSPLGRSLVEKSGRNPDDLSSFYVIRNYDRPEATFLEKGKAALFVATQLGWPWRAAGVFAMLPGRLLDAVYDLVARHRYRLFGKRDQCLLPTPSQRSRFLD